jgi:hypothetical protein
MLVEKKLLGVEELEAQTALELPEREMLALVNVTLGNLAVQVPVGVAANVCDINAAVLIGQIQDTGSATCEATADSKADARQIARIFNL